MPVFHVTAPDGTTYEVNGPDGSTEQDALAHVQAQHQPAAPAAPGTTSQSLGFEQGVGNFLANAAQPGIWAGKKLGLDMSTFEQGGDILRNPEHALGEVPGKTGRFAADVLEGAPLAAMAPAGLAGTVASGAATGAMTSDKDRQGTGAVMGAGGGALLHGLGRAIAPQVSDAVQRLAAAGTTMTPGQIFGGAIKGVEDRLAGFPLVGDFITQAQNRSLETAGRGAINRSLTPIGQALPPGSVGQDAITHAGDALSANYDHLLPQMQVSLGGPFAQAVGDASQRVDARLPSEMGNQFAGTLSDVFKKLTSGVNGPSNTFSGEAAHEAASDLGRMSRTYAGRGGNDTELGNAYGSVEGAFRDAARTSNPQLGPQLAANDEGWANLVRLEDAAKAATGNASGKAPGVFTGQQLRTAARAGDNSVRDRATARGEALLQPYAEDMIQVLPSSVGDSGTAGRNALAALVLGGAAHAVTPAAVAAGAAIPALYSRTGLQVFNRMYAHGNSPGATALGDLFQNMGRYGAGPAAGAFTAGRK